MINLINRKQNLLLYMSFSRLSEEPILDVFSAFGLCDKIFLNGMADASK